jgi:NTP pyrophosphatase (non-canonical NTP hydrolase)
MCGFLHRAVPDHGELPMSNLTFDQLRHANVNRLPHFKNRKGEPAHSETDGSDWLLSAWSNAASGEFGEVAEALLDFMLFTKIAQHLGKGSDLIKKIERGDVTLDEKRKALADEFADVITYVDILAFRSGIDLGEAARSKWNEVSERVGYSVRI